jgi:DNA-binding transcriptional MerR regulator
MFRIGDFSALCQASVKTLHHYDEIGLLKPAHTDPSTGYRYYAPEQMARVARIRALKEMGFSLDDVREMLCETGTPERITALLEAKRAELTERVQEEQERLARVEANLRQASAPDSMARMLGFPVTLKSLPAVRVASVRRLVETGPGLSRALHELLAEVWKTLKKHRASASGHPFFLWHDPEWRDAIEVEAAVPLVGPLPDTVPLHVYDLSAVPAAACVIYRGTGETMRARQQLAAWIAARDYRIVGPRRSTVLHYGAHDPAAHAGGIVAPADLVVEYQQPVAEAAGDTNLTLEKAP